MGDPIFDEDGILEQLASPVIAQYANVLQSAAAQTIIDMYDRKVTRDEFIIGLEAPLHMFGYVEKLKTMKSVKEAFDADAVNAENIAEANAVITTKLRTLCLKVSETVKRLQQCPTSMDPVH